MMQTVLFQTEVRLLKSIIKLPIYTRSISFVEQTSFGSVSFTFAVTIKHFSPLKLKGLPMITHVSENRKYCCCFYISDSNNTMLYFCLHSK